MGETEAIEQSERRFYEILFREPQFFHNADDETAPICAEVVSVVFDDGKEVRLKSKGCGSYDYDAMAKVKYDALPTTEQIRSLIQKEGREPMVVRYRFQDDRYREKPLTLELQYGFVKALKKETPLASAPFEILDSTDGSDEISI